MKRQTALLLAVLLSVYSAGCSSSSDSSSPRAVPQRAALEVEVIPNPIVAKHVSGETYDFAFTISLRETNGVAVEIDRVSMEVLAFGALVVHEESYDRKEIARRGFPTAVGGGQEIRYTFTPRKEVPDDRLFGGVSAELRAEGTDANGNRVTATTSVTVRR